MRVYAATKNPGKLRELREIAAPYGIAIETWDAYADPEETADSYAGNAAIKARALHGQLAAAGVRAPVLADDSGLEISALGGRPGVHSARYAGAHATWPERRAEILREVAASGSEDRGARFVCVVCYIDAAGAEIYAEGIVGGELTRDERGELGFGYDPIFYEPSEHATFAQLSEKQKNSISHRAKAVHELVGKLETS
ncbi:MAG: RdgB/HAM1 family non-canonical purine NTP pyrophosphatase [Candidatus Eremiobacteraeota bacterium]|nr:RdgB/HAM1 family non-canonical purine NTP pyrophosphatase [Candidatus Eremiobacteraeota bacterium]